MRRRAFAVLDREGLDSGSMSAIFGAVDFVWSTSDAPEMPLILALLAFPFQQPATPATEIATIVVSPASRTMIAGDTYHFLPAKVSVGFKQTNTGGY